MIKYIIFSVMLMLLSTNCIAGEYPGIANLNTQAHTLYIMGKYNDSIRLYDQALSYADISDHSASVALFGKALSCYKVGVYGLAIYYSEQSTISDPSQEQLLAARQLKYACQVASGDVLGAAETDRLIKIQWYGTGYYEGQNTTSQASNIRPYQEPKY